MDDKKPNLNPRQKAQINPLSRKWAIKAYCWECSGDSTSEVDKCEIKACPLWKFRKRG